jgi:hypothetical protein
VEAVQIVRREATSGLLLLNLSSDLVEMDRERRQRSIQDPGVDIERRIGEPAHVFEELAAQRQQLGVVKPWEEVLQLRDGW